MLKNVASQKIAVWAWDRVNGVPKAGDAANITAQISKDGGASAASDDANPTELDATNHPGVYEFDLTQAETNADQMCFTPISVTANIVFDPKTVLIYPKEAMRGTDSAALASALATVAGYVDTEVAAIKAKTDLLPSGVAKNVALSNFPFKMVDATDFATPETGLTVTATISKDGAAFGACTNAAAEIANGWYKINLTQAEMNADVIALKFSAAGAAQRDIAIITT